MNTLKKKANFIIIKKAIPNKFLNNFKKKLNLLVNSIIRSRKLKIDQNLSLDIKLLVLEEMDHKHIEFIYNEIKNFNILKNFEKHQSIRKIIENFLNKNFVNFTRAVRLDLANNYNWNLSWHQESSYVGKSKKFIFLWFPVLNHCDDKIGGLEIYNKFTKKNYNFKLIRQTQKQIQKIPKITLHKKYYKDVNLNLGDLLIFDKYLLHRSVENKSYRAKLSCVLSYCIK